MDAAEVKSGGASENTDAECSVGFRPAVLGLPFYILFHNTCFPRVFVLLQASPPSYRMYLTSLVQTCQTLFNRQKVAKKSPKFVIGSKRYNEQCLYSSLSPTSLDVRETVATMQWHFVGTATLM